MIPLLHVWCLIITWSEHLPWAITYPKHQILQMLTRSPIDVTSHQFLSAIASTFWGAKIAQKILWLVWFFRTTINFFELSYFSVYRSSTFSHARRLSSIRTLLNYGRPKGQFGSSHEKFEIWSWTKNPSYLVRSLLYIKRCPHISFLLN